jgi:hypothetical protein
VLIGNLSRSGKSRRAHRALDHDMEPLVKLMPFGVHHADTSETWLSFITGSVTADFMANRLHEIWTTLKNGHHPQTLVINKTLVTNADNGPENNTARTQWPRRLVAFCTEYHVSVKLACYPPYHSKYNLMERVFGVLILACVHNCVMRA